MPMSFFTPCSGQCDLYLRSASMAYNSLNTSGRSHRLRSSTLCAPYRWNTESTTADPTWELIVEAVFSMLMIQFSRSSLVTILISFLLSLPFRSQLRYLHHLWKLNSSLIGGCIQRSDGEVGTGVVLCLFMCVYNYQPLTETMFLCIIK